MAKGPTRPWRLPAPHTAECLPFIHAALAQGHEAELQIDGIPDRARADYLRRGLFNAARLRGVSVHVRTVKTTNGYVITFATHDKTRARAHVLEKYGEDRQKWPYNPRAAVARDELGNRSD